MVLCGPSSTMSSERLVDGLSKEMENQRLRWVQVLHD